MKEHCENYKGFFGFDFHSFLLKKKKIWDISFLFNFTEKLIPTKMVASEVLQFDKY